MSAEAAVQFLERIESDPAMSSELRQYESSEDKLIEAVLDMGAREGLNFSAAEFEAAIRHHGGQDGELDDSALEAVAGGGLLRKLARKLWWGSGPGPDTGPSGGGGIRA